MLVRADAGNVAAVGRDREGSGVNTLRAEGARLSAIDVLHVEAHAVAGFVAGEDDVLAIRKPFCPGVVDLVVGQLAGFAGAGGQQNQLRGRSLRLCDRPLFVGRERYRSAGAQQDRG